MRHLAVVLGTLLGMQLGARAPAAAQAISLAPGSFTNFSQVVPSTATTVIPAHPSGQRVRIVAIDTAIAGYTDLTVTTWCAWGTAAANPAVVGANGFPLNAGFDDKTTGVNQGPLNCIQPSGTHYIRLETY